MDFAHEECFDKKKEFLFHFLLPKSSYVVTITINPTSKVS